VDVIRGLSGVTKPLRAYVDPSRVCLYGLFLFFWVFGFLRILFELMLVSDLIRSSIQ